VRRTVGQLINAEDDAWPLVLEAVASASRPVEVLPVEASRGEATLFSLQVTTRSEMGAIALRSAGLQVDHGWLRILGAGGGRIGDGLREWNALDGRPSLDPKLEKALIIAYDAVGGFFALNGGAWPGQPGLVHYFAPDTYDRQPFNVGYGAFLQFALTGDVDGFYGNQRWPGWEHEIAALGPDETISMYPFLGFGDKPIVERARKPVPAREAWTFHNAMSEQLRDVPSDGRVEVRFKDR
jgi:hypothetical protein